jgi:Tol biopolymer transport system component
MLFQATGTGSDETLLASYNLEARTRVRMLGYALTNEHAISADGLTIAFRGKNGVYSGAPVLLWTTNNLVSVHTSDSSLQLCGLSADGRFLCLLDGPSGFTPQIYRKDLQSNQLVLVSLTMSGSDSRWSHRFSTPLLSPDARLVAFQSPASDLVEGDFNGMGDVFVRDVEAGTTELISRAEPARPSAGGYAHSFLGPRSLSADGRFLVTLRHDDHSAPRDTNGWADIYVQDILTGTNFALSIDTNVYFGPNNTNVFESPFINESGNFLVAMQRRGPPAIFGISLTNTPLVPLGLSQLLRPSYYALAAADSPSLSADGLRMVFRCEDMTFDYQNDANGFSDVWLRYLRILEYQTNRLATNYVQLSSAYGGAVGGANGPSMAPVISANGTRAAFATRAGNLISTNAGGIAGQFSSHQIVACDLGPNQLSTNGLYNLARRLCSYTISYAPYVWTDGFNTNITHTNLNAVLAPVPVDASSATFSPDGRHVFYGLANGDSVWRHDLLATQSNYYFVSNAPGSNYLGVFVSTNLVPGASNALVCSNCQNFSVSADGSAVAYERPRAGGTVKDVFARNLPDGLETLVSRTESGEVANGPSSMPLISGDGRFVVFQTRASNLTVGDTNGVMDIYARDRLRGVTLLVSANSQGRAGNGPSRRPVMAGDGRTIAFQSLASDLAGSDINDRRDVFLLRLGSPDTDHDGMDDDWEAAHFGDLSHDGTADGDGDGASDLAEFRAGTDPTNGNSVFRVLTLQPAAGGGRLILWTASPNWNYRVEFKDDLGAPTWTPLNGIISWNGGLASLVDGSATNSPSRIYRAVRLP